ncbi:MAG: hypothetical protein GMKNLPBB_02084 [Myxococcota bacterium]|nr:hypothetical protein [Myxococcota bacterium]
MKFLRALDGYVSRVESVVLISILGFMTGYHFLQVVCEVIAGWGTRTDNDFVQALSGLANRANQSISQVGPIVDYEILFIGLIGAALATRYNSHVNVDAVGRLLPPKPKLIIKTILDFIATGICGVFAAAASTFIKQNSGDELINNAPRGLFTWFLPLALGAFALVFAADALRLRKPPAPAPEEPSAGDEDAPAAHGVLHIKEFDLADPFNRKVSMILSFAFAALCLAGALASRVHVGAIPEGDPVHITAFPMQIIILYSFGVMGFRFLTQGLDGAAELARGGPAKEAP